MKASEIRDLSIEEIKETMDETREELMNLRFQLATGELTDYTRLSETKRTIARLITILKEKEIAEEEEVA